MPVSLCKLGLASLEDFFLATLASWLTILGLLSRDFPQGLGLDRLETVGLASDPLEFDLDRQLGLDRRDRLGLDFRLWLGVDLREWLGLRSFFRMLPFGVRGSILLTLWRL